MNSNLPVWKAPWSRMKALLDARNKEFYRDHAALGWSLAFPVLVVIGFAFVFSRGSQDVYKVMVHAPLVGGQEATTQIAGVEEFKKLKYIEFVPTEDLNASIDKLKRHQVDLVLSSSEGGRLWVNSSSPKGYFLDKMAPASLKREAVEGKEIRYVDWLISGLIAMNIMFGAFFGIGYTIVRYRKTGVLKRLKATPLRPVEFLVAQVFSRLMVIMGVSSVVFAGTHAVIHFRMLGSYLDLFIVMALGGMCLISMSLVIAARISSEEFANGLLNLLSWPMMFLSGVWFSLEGSQPWVQKVAQIFPLTHVIDAARKVMTEGATLVQVAPHLAVLSAMTVVFLALGSWLFRWT